MTRGDGNGPLTLHSIPTIGQVKRNLEAAKARCEQAQRPYPPLLVDLEYVVMQLEAQYQENAILRIGLEQAADRFADLMHEPEYGEVAARAAANWHIQARSALGDIIDEDGQDEDR